MQPVDTLIFLIFSILYAVIIFFHTNTMSLIDLAIRSRRVSDDDASVATPKKTRSARKLKDIDVTRK